MAKGSSSSSSITNLGKTPNSQQIKASSGLNAEYVKDTVLSVNYAPNPQKVPIDTNLADWYRNGASIASPAGTTQRPQKTIDPLEEEVASIRVFGKDPKAQTGDVELIPGFNRLILESVQEGHAERSQVVETFGSFYVFLFGERPPTYTYSGTLINTKDINWRADFQFYYDSYLRGTRCVERYARVVMTYGGRQVEGFMMNFQTSTDSSLEAGVKVSFQVLITDRLRTLNISKDFGLTEGVGAQTSNNVLRQLIDSIAGKEGRGLAEPATSIAFKETVAVMAGGPALTPMKGTSLPSNFGILA